MSIKVSQVSKSYASLKAVNNISFSIEKGEVVGFLGPNGAGKSTVMKILTGFIKDYEGAVYINDIVVSKNTLEIQKHIGYLPEHNPLYTDMYVREYLAFNAGIYKIPSERINEVIVEVGLLSHANSKIAALSKGYRQRVGLAAALLHNPDVLILDEPTTGLDPNQLVEIRALIKKMGRDKTVLFSSHIMQEVEAVCDRVIILDKGKIVSDTSLENLTNTTNQLIKVEFDKMITKEVFVNLDHLKKAVKTSDTTWELLFSSEEDKREFVFDLAQENGLKILNLTRETKNLEHLFRALTS